MNLIELSDGHIDILHAIVHREVQRLAAGDTKEGETVNYDQAAHVLTIYDRLTLVASKWKGKRPQRPQFDDAYAELVEGSRLYLAMDGTLRKIPPPD